MPESGVEQSVYHGASDERVARAVYQLRALIRLVS